MSNPLRVFLDANVLAKPVTRSLVWFCAAPGGYQVVWSAYVEAEADRHVRGHQTPISAVRRSVGIELGPTGDVMEPRFVATSTEDRQVLADAVAADALVIVTEDVDDYARDDLATVGITAVNPDLFLSVRATAEGYRSAVDRMAKHMTDPRVTPAQLHARLGRQHPCTVTAYGAVFGIEPLPPTHSPPTVMCRGDRCLVCARVSTSVRLGVCARCAGLAGAGAGGDPGLT